MARQRKRRRKSSRPKQPPWHFWGVVVAALLRSLGRALEYLLRAFQHEGYMGQYSSQEIAFLNSYPALYTACWALGVWSAVAGGALMIARKAVAIYCFYLSLAGIAATAFWALTTPMPGRFSSQLSWLFTALTVLLMVLLIVYTRRMVYDRVLN